MIEKKERRTCRAFTPKSEENRCLIQAKYQTSSMSTCLTYIHNLYIKLYLSKSKKKRAQFHVLHSSCTQPLKKLRNQEKRKKIKEEIPHQSFDLIYTAHKIKCLFFCCDMYSCHCPPPSPDLCFNQHGFNGKNETTHCSNKKAREIRAIFPSPLPPHYSPTYFLLLRKP